MKIPCTVRNSIDEVIAGYKGRTAGILGQYIQNKPHKWGFKLYCRASDDGFLHDIMMYQEQSTFDAHREQLPGDQASMPVSVKIVLALSKTIDHAGPSIVYADNFFSSLKCVQELKEHYKCRYTGTA